MRAGLPGCECFAVASCLWSSTGLEIHQVPAGLGCWRYGTQPSGGWKWKQMLSPPFQTPGHPKWGSDLVAPLQPHSPAIGDWANTMLYGPVIPPSLQRVWPGKAVPKGEGGGKVSKASQALKMHPPHLHSLLLSCTLKTTPSCWASQTQLMAGWTTWWVSP